MEPAATQSFDVVIVGAGIAGSALAVALAPQGWRILLIEAGAPSPELPQIARTIAEVDPRVSALSTSSVELLQDLGAWQRIPEQVPSSYESMRVWEEDGSGLIEFRAAEVQQARLGHIVENRWITSALLQQLLQARNIEMRTAVRLLGLQRAVDSSGSLHLQLSQGGAVQTTLLVGADGAQSAVRKLCALPSRDSDCGQRAIVATIRTSLGHGRTARQRFLQTGPLALLPLNTLGGEKACSIVWSADLARAEELAALDDVAFAAELQRNCESCLGQVLEVTRRYSFPLRQAHALNYVAPGVALVGDAAHVVHPLAGQGINLGLADVRVLAAELQRARQRTLAPGALEVLGRYERRRRGENELMIRAMDAFRRLFGDDRLLPRLVRNAGMSAVHRISPLKREFMRHAMGLG